MAASEVLHPNGRSPGFSRRTRRGKYANGGGPIFVREFSGDCDTSVNIGNFDRSARRLLRRFHGDRNFLRRPNFFSPVFSFERRRSFFLMRAGDGTSGDKKYLIVFSG